MYSYRAYHLGIKSALPLPGLHFEKVSPDITFELESVFEPPAELVAKPWHFDIASDKASLFFRDVGLFQIHNGCRVVVRPLSGVEEAVLQRYLMGTVMAVLLYQRGLLVLHGSAVLINGIAAAFLGGPGSGKSTMAAVMRTRGHEVLSDDITALNMEPDPPDILPGFSLLKLDEEVARFLNLDFDAMHSMERGETKRLWDVSDGFQAVSCQLRKLFILGVDGEVSIEPVSPSDAFLKLTQHSFPTRMMNTGGPEHFRRCAEFIERISIYYLQRPGDMGRILRTAEEVERFMSESL